jgi:rhodanese-related sulfurtransferase
MTLTSLSPAAARDMILRGARLIDIREADEHARARIHGAVSMPLSSLGALPGQVQSTVIFHCLSGNRTQVNAARLAAATDRPAYTLAGGLDAWRAAGLPVVSDARQPIEIMRQVQIAAGSLVVAGALLGALVAPGFAWLSAAVGAGLVFAGVTGWCGMANILRRLPWNARAQAQGNGPGI